MNRKATSKFKIPEIPQPGLILPDHAGMNNLFGLTPPFVTWDNKVTSTERLFREQQNSENFKTMTWIQDLPHPR